MILKFRAQTGQIQSVWSSLTDDRSSQNGVDENNRKLRESDLLKLGEDDETQKNVHVNARRTSVKNKDQNKRPLDPNHKYFLIIDDEDTGGETLEGRDFMGTLIFTNLNGPISFGPYDRVHLI